MARRLANRKISAGASENQSEHEAACSSLHKGGDLPKSAYENRRLTPAGWLLTANQCSRSFENAFQGRTPRYKKAGKELLNRWQQFGCASLGDWPPQNAGLDLLDYFLRLTEKNLPDSCSNSKSDCARNQTWLSKQEAVGHDDGFSITEEVFRDAGNGKIVCLTTGEVVQSKVLRERGKGTWLKVTLEV